MAGDAHARDIRWRRGQLPHLHVTGSVQLLGIQLLLNGEVMQEASTSQMIFSVAYRVSFISQVITLEPGDIIATGTPSGVGVFRDPPRLLQHGDTVEVVIDTVGTLTNPVVDEKGRKV